VVTPPPELAQTWALARTTLSRTRRLVIFGFAFNPYDGAVLDLLGSTGESVEQLLLIDPAPNLEIAQRLWPNASVRATDHLLMRTCERTSGSISRASEMHTLLVDLPGPTVAS
jgi:hypothetical protein